MLLHIILNGSTSYPLYAAGVAATEAAHTRVCIKTAQEASAIFGPNSQIRFPVLRSLYDLFVAFIFRGKGELLFIFGRGPRG